jgi:hypothetical protein
MGRLAQLQRLPRRRNEGGCGCGTRSGEEPRRCQTDRKKEASPVSVESRIRNQPQLSLTALDRLQSARKDERGCGAATGGRAIWELATITSRSTPSGLGGDSLVGVVWSICMIRRVPRWESDLFDPPGETPALAVHWGARDAANASDVCGREWFPRFHRGVWRCGSWVGLAQARWTPGA